MTDSQQVTSSFNPVGIRDRILAAVERARSQDFNSFVEEFQISHELTSLRRPPDTVVVVDDADGSSVALPSSNARLRSTPSSGNSNATDSPNQAEEINTATETSSEDSGQNRNLRHEINQLRALSQNRELQPVWLILSRIFPFIFLFFSKFLIDNFFPLLNLVAAFGILCFSNNFLVSSLRGNKYYNLFKATVCVPVFLNMQCFIFGFESIFTVLSFKVDPANKNFFTTFCAVSIADLFVKNLSILAKIIVAAFPPFFLASKRQRRIFQWFEYTSQIYQYFLPVPQWCYFFLYVEEGTLTNYSGYFLAVLYVFYKLYRFLELGKCWFNSTRYVCRLTSVGSKASRSEIEYQQQCTICYSEFDGPIKLNCGHLFCEECISTWLDKEHTCPMCRTVVAKEDNSWKGGETRLLPRFF